MCVPTAFSAICPFSGFSLCAVWLRPHEPMYPRQVDNPTEGNLKQTRRDLQLSRCINERVFLVFCKLTKSVTPTSRDGATVRYWTIWFGKKRDICWCNWGDTARTVKREQTIYDSELITWIEARGFGLCWTFVAWCPRAYSQRSWNWNMISSSRLWEMRLARKSEKNKPRGRWNPKLSNMKLTWCQVFLNFFSDKQPDTLVPYSANVSLKLSSADNVLAFGHTVGADVHRETLAE